MKKSNNALKQHPNFYAISIKIAGKSNSKTSASADSIDRSTMSPETHRRSKSILKKHDTSNGTSNAHRNGPSKNDPEMEKLISDNMSAASGSEYSPGKSAPIMRSAAALATYSRQASQSKLPIQLVGITGGTANSEVVLLQDLLGTAHTAAPLYICPPPPPMEQSPNEESLLLQQNESKGYPSVRYL